MSGLNALSLGIVLFLLAGWVLLVFFALFSAFQRSRKTARPISLPQDGQTNGVLLVEPGGRVGYINAAARAWFHLGDEQPNLERLARRVHPQQAFFNLCAREGRARLSVDGMPVEAASFAAPYPNGHALLVTLQQPQPGLPVKNTPDASGPALQILAGLNQAITAELDLDAALQAVLQAVEQVIPADLIEITLWDDSQQVYIPYRLGTAAGEGSTERPLLRLDPPCEAHEGLTGWLGTRQIPLRLDDVQSFTEAQPAAGRKLPPFQSFLGVPLLASGELVGTLEAVSAARTAFKPEHLELMQILAGQAAAALHNARLYRIEQQRARELAGLAGLAAAAAASHEPDELFARLIEPVASMLDVRILGFLVYDESRRTLVAQPPFLGLQPEILEWNNIELTPGSPAEEIWLSGEALVTDCAPQDPQFMSLGLHHLATAAGIRCLALIPLTSAGRTLGYLQAGEKKDGRPFDAGDLRLLKIIAGQAGPLIENAALVRQARHRAQRAETLRRIASLAGSNATRDEFLKYALLDLARLLQADVAAFFLLDEERGELRLHAESAFGVSPESGWAPIPCSIRDPEFSSTVAGSRQPFITEDLQSQVCPPRYRPLVDLLDLHAVIHLPVVSGEQVLGELLLGSRKAGFFSPGDVRSAEIVSGQVAAVVERPARGQSDHQAAGAAPGVLARTDASQAYLRPSREEVLLESTRQISARWGLEIYLTLEARSETSANGSGETSDGPALRLIGQSGVPAGVNPEALLGQRNPIRQAAQSRQALLIADLKEHPEWENSPLLQALGLQALICLPILEKERVEAVILAGSKSALSPFIPADEQHLRLIGGQTAIALENIRLLAEARRRLQEVNLLLDFTRRIAGLQRQASPERSGSTEDIARLLLDSALSAVPTAQAAAVFLWDRPRELLIPQAVSGYASQAALMEIALQRGEGLPGQAFADNRAIRIAEVDFARHYRLNPENLLRFRNAAAGASPVSSMVVPLSAFSQAAQDTDRQDSGPESEPFGVVVLEHYQAAGAFTPEDEALIASLARQTALALENAGLFWAAERRARQLQALSEAAAATAASLQTDQLRAALLDRLGAVLPYDTATLWLPAGREAPLQTMVVAETRGFEDRETRRGLSVNIEDSRLLSEMIHSGEPLYVPDVRLDARFPAIVEYERLSWLGVPLVASNRVFGVIALEKAEANFYTGDHIQLLSAFASQAAVGLQNADLYEESVRRAQELDMRSQLLGVLYQLARELSRSLDLDHILNSAINGLSQVVQASCLSAVLFDEGDRPSLEAEMGYSEAALPLSLPLAPLFERLRETQGIFHTEDWSSENELQPLAAFLQARGTRSLLALPLTTGEHTHGIFLVHNDQAYRFNTGEIELARAICNQAAVAVQNARLYAETRSRSQDLEARVLQRTAELEREHRRTETLLKVITELSASLDLEQVLNRTLRVLQEMVGASHISVLARQGGEPELHHLAAVDSGESIHIEPVDRLLAIWAVQKRQAALTDDLQQDERWPALAETDSGVHSAMIVPLVVGAEPLGALLLYHTMPGCFTLDQLEMLQATGNQMAIAINNAGLYRLLRDQAEDLGAMLRDQQVASSRSMAILEAVADGVLVTDARQNITLFNRAAEKILGLSRDEVTGKSLKSMTGLFGRAARSWHETIQKWTQDPASYQPGELYAGEITLEDGRVVSVHLAPVILRSDFLGTVSIFQDITHRVEVDRLKSEFVATVSHELRTPMTSIKGYVDILLMGAAGPLSDQQKRFLEIVKVNSERLIVLVNDLLDISRIESGRAALSIQPLDLTSLARELTTGLQQRSRQEEKTLTITCEADPDLPPVQGDPERVRQILSNLLDNAYQYSTPGGRIDVRLHVDNGFVQVDVSDTGVGIPPDEQERVFERFFRGEGPLTLGVPGTGLGLSIVQNLVQMHNGRIWLQSSGVPGEGTTFSFTLPVHRPEI